MKSVIIGVKFPDNFNEFVSMSRSYSEKEALRYLQRHSLQRIGGDQVFVEEAGSQVTEILQGVFLYNIPVLKEKQSTWNTSNLPVDWIEFMLIEKLPGGRYSFSLYQNKNKSIQTNDFIRNKQKRYSVCL